MTLREALDILRLMATDEILTTADTGSDPMLKAVATWQRDTPRQMEELIGLVGVPHSAGPVSRRSITSHINNVPFQLLEILRDGETHDSKELVGKLHADKHHVVTSINRLRRGGHRIMYVRTEGLFGSYRLER